MKKIIFLIILCGLFLAADNAQATEQKISVPLTFDDYYSYADTVEAIQALNKAFPNLTKVDLVGKSEEDRAIYCVTVNNPETGAELDKPAVYIDGNIHGNEIQATEVCLYFLNYILTKYGENENITEVVDKNCFYVIPSVNVDGRYHFFNDPNTSSSNRGLRRPKDDDRDGLINEDSEGYVDPNRNWGFDWMPEYVQSGAGDFPFSGKGIKAIATFIRQRPNICMVWAFHNSGGLYLRGPSQKKLSYPLQDIQVYDYLGKQGERITPGYQYLVSWKDLYTTYGDFVEWMVGCNGAYGFVGELFQSSTETFKTRE